MKTEKPLDIFKKYRGVVADYFSWYATFQNKDMVKEVELTSSDFVCSTGCKLNINHRLSIIDLVIPKEMFKEITESEAQRYEIPLKLKLK